MLNNSSDKIKKEFENLRNELLDLTLRNQLLNFKTRARTITISNQSPINIYQTLVLQNNKMYFVANKKEKKEEKVVLDEKFYTQKEEKSDTQIQQEMLELQKMLKEGKL